jgi:Peptidase propeptide and YPEB domain
MRLTVRVLFVAIGTALFIAGGLSPDHPATTRSEPARAATVVRVQQPSGSEQREPGRDSADRPATGAAADRARQAAEAAVSGATAGEVEREANDDPGSAYEVELVRPDGSAVEVDLDTGFKVLATDRDGGRDND